MIEVDTAAVTERQYTVVLRGPSGVFMHRNQDMALRNLSFGGPRFDVIFRSRFVGEEAFARSLWAEVSGPAPDIRAAISQYSQAARNLTDAISFANNAPISPLDIEIAFETTPGTDRQEFFQQFLPEDRPPPHPGRVLERDASLEMLVALFSHARADRLVRAVAHYSEALRSWHPGGEIPALAHIFIGFEALTPVRRSRYLSERGLNREALCSEWEVELRALDAEIRRRLLFQGDDATYQKVKEASDAYEHSFRPFQDIRTIAVELREKAASYLRTAVLEELTLTDQTSEKLLVAPRTKPFSIRYAKYVWGELLGSGDDPAHPEEQYPRVRWLSQAGDGTRLDEETFNIDRKETFTPRLAEGFSLRLTGVEIWGGPKVMRPNAGTDDSVEESPEET